MVKERRLSRGLQFLLSSAESEFEPGKSRDVAIDEISINPWQPRSEFDTKSLEDLAQSIRRHGLVQPLLVRPRNEGGFELIAGERRLRAAKLAGLQMVPALVREVGDQDMLPIALVENIQRQDLGPVERARAFRRLADEHGLSHQQIAEVSGLARSTVSNCLRLLDLDGEVLGALTQGRLTEGHARTLLAEGDANRRKELFKELLDGGLSVREVEDKVASGGAATSRTRGARSKTAEARKLERQISGVLGGMTVEIRERGQRGKVVVTYRNLEEFDRFFQALTRQSPDV